MVEMLADKKVVYLVVQKVAKRAVNWVAWKVD